MWRVLKALLLLWPILLLVYFVGSFVVGQAIIDKKLKEAHGLVWKDKDNHITVNVIQTSQGELSSYEITLLDNDHNVLFKDLFVIDADMYGGGFVKAVQADSDRDLELMVWGGHEREKSYALDFSKGDIKRTDFEELPFVVRELAKQWHQSYVINRMNLLLVVIMTLFYYGIAVTFVLLIKALRRFRERRV